MKTFIYTACLLALPLATMAQSSYSLKAGAVTYGGKTVKYADAKTFKSLGYGYGKDAKHVYYLGNILEYVDPDGFRVSLDFQCPKTETAKNGNTQTAKKNNVQAVGKKTTSTGNTATAAATESKPSTGLEGLSRVSEILNRGTVQTFETVPADSDSTALASLYLEYTKKDREVYYGSTLVKGVIVSQFENLGMGYGKDATAVYYIGIKMEGAQPESFEVLKGEYCRDELSAYYKGQKLQDAIGKDFHYDGNGFASDGTHYYIYGNRIEK